MTGGHLFRDRQGSPKNLCDKDSAELSGDLSGAICLKTFVLLPCALELLGNFRRTNVQQLTCNIDLSCYFYFCYLFFFSVLIELKPFVLNGESPGGKFLKNSGKVWKSVKISETMLPLSCCPNYLVLFVRFWGFGVLFWPLKRVAGMAARGL